MAEKIDMAIEFTESQQKVIHSRGHNLLVSAAAGSGKTAVLVERIIRMITDPDHPVDIDRLLVVTFTKAAAAQMREKISAAIDKTLENPQQAQNAHLLRQKTLIHHAQIMTIDSFCSYLLHNHFSEIGLDPGFRQMDETEAGLLEHDVCHDFLEEQYQAADPEFLKCVNFFCEKGSDHDLEEDILRLVHMSATQPDPKSWLKERFSDYAVKTEKDITTSVWFCQMMVQVRRELGEVTQLYNKALEICSLPSGPYKYRELLLQERDHFAKAAEAELPVSHSADASSVFNLFALIIGSSDSEIFGRLPRITHKDETDPDLKDQVMQLRSAAKAEVGKLRNQYFSLDLNTAVHNMAACSEPAAGLLHLTLAYLERLQKVKQQKNVIDFSDLEHLALRVMAVRDADGTFKPTDTALAYRRYYIEIMIDEYQDSNDVQEALLSMIGGDGEGHYCRFMVGDVKQSIYRFRSARPEIFEEKYNTYRENDPERELILLDQNFRSRSEVLDSVNAFFMKIMRREIGGVEYDSRVTLKPGAEYAPFEETGCIYDTELLLVDGALPEDDNLNGDESGAGDKNTAAEKQQNQPAAVEQQDSDGRDADEEQQDTVAELSSKRKEALAIAQRIRQLVYGDAAQRPLLVRDEDNGRLRPLRFGDIVILVRSSSAWNDAVRDIFDREGIPVYLNYNAGYFAAEEIRQILQLLRVLDNPRQDIPLYGVLRGYFGQFSEEEIALIRGADIEEQRSSHPGLYEVQPAEDVSDLAEAPKEHLLFDALTAYADSTAEQSEYDSHLARKCEEFLDQLQKWRQMGVMLPIHELIRRIVAQTGYEDYIAALPSGAQRKANLQVLYQRAEDYEKTEYTGLFDFLRYIDSMHEHEVDYGEANALDEQADLVHVMTIHKSKGLEFPVVFVAGLGGGFAFSRDTGRSLLLDADAGLGMRYFNEEQRYETDTLRRQAIAQKIRSLGEELRVLYVAMTRAKEKLILSGYTRNAQNLRSRMTMAAESVSAAAHLPVSAIEGAGSYLELILMTLSVPDYPVPVKVQQICISDLELTEVSASVKAQQRRKELAENEVIPLDALPDQDLLHFLEKRFCSHYAHENLQNLFTKTTVTELKSAALEEVYGEEEGEGAIHLYPDAEEIIPRFMEDMNQSDSSVQMSCADADEVHKTYTDTASRAAGGPSLTGAGRGTAIHRICELIDYRKWENPASIDRGTFKDWILSLCSTGKIPRLYAEVADYEVFRPFLHSDVAMQMAQADSRGLLFREQPFVYGVDASRIRDDFPKGETVLVQGIIDAFYRTQNGLTLLDYKTDHVSKPQQLIERYHVQLDIYADVLQHILNIPVTRRVIYSFALNQEIELPMPDTGKGQYNG